MTTLQETVRTKLKKLAKPSIKEGSEKYFKNVITFHGVKAADVKKVMKETFLLLKNKPIEEAVRESFSLLASDIFEEKQVGVGILSKYVQKLPENILKKLGPIFEKHVYDWATSDMLSGRVLRFLIKKDEKPTMRAARFVQH